MAGLQRSVVSFRRNGSSGLVWEDKAISGELKTHQHVSEQSGPSNQKAELRKMKSDGGVARRMYRTVKVEEADDPPSPRVSGCGFFSVFNKPVDVKPNKKKVGKHKNK
ncbi:uncharacterized protein At1g15400-like [Silene latifolia]|uniref:uncharacterized protein At1g15400-like n=1 Tax=Silene latifolia TaxID=37657 RepID=UPI003D76DF01